MIESIRHIKSRIRGIEGTRKLTKAMEMVSVAKLKRTEKISSSFEQYFVKLEAFIKNILSEPLDFSNPYLEPRKDKQKIALCLITSDTGFCSIYNHVIIKAADKFLSGYSRENVKLIIIGRKGFNYFSRKQFNISRSYIGLNGRYSQEVCENIFSQLNNVFLSGQAGEVYLAYAYSKTASCHIPVIEKFFNLDYLKGTNQQYMYEPDRSSILQDLIPVYALNKLKKALLDTFISEHKARAVAMGEATKNALDILERLILLRNKMRQANITKEIMEVISSAEALKG